MFQHFYHKLLRKYVSLFGHVFNEIDIVRTNPQTGSEIQRFKVPIEYSPKDKYVTRLESDPDLYKQFQTTLPRMGFEIRDITYDAPRKQNSLLRMAKGDTASRVSSTYMGVPYDITWDLSIYAKSVDDGNQIVEKILPVFTPDYTITITPIATLGFLKDIPLILEGVNPDIQYMGGADDVRVIIWTLTFKMKAYFFGPISTPKIIRKSIANIFNDPSLVTGYVVRMNMDVGNNGTFQIMDTVYMGDSMQSAKAYGIVTDWNQENQTLMVGAAQGSFKTNNVVRAASSNAAYTIESFAVDPLKLVKIIVEPDPITAEPGDEFGYAESIQEFPNINESL